MNNKNKKIVIALVSCLVFVGLIAGSGILYYQKIIIPNRELEALEALLVHFEARTYEGEEGFTMEYRLRKPVNYDANKKYPLLIFLHGSGQRGNDNREQLNVHAVIAYRLVTGAYADNELYNCFILAPQCPDDMGWGASWDDDLPLSSKAVITVIDDMLADESGDYSIDGDRLYLTGLSMGGGGTWALITAYPGKFACAVPICGYGDSEKAYLIKDEKIWTFHGDKDWAVDVKYTRDIVAALRAHGSDVKYTEYRREGHLAWFKAYREPGLMEFIFDIK